MMSERRTETPACGHEAPAFGSAMCSHLRANRETTLKYVKWYTGVGLDKELLCVDCAERRQEGVAVTVARVCEPCFERAVADYGEVVGSRGCAGIGVRPEPFDVALVTTSLPSELGTVTDLAPMNEAAAPVWLMLEEAGQLFRVDVETLDFSRVGRTSVEDESDLPPVFGHASMRHLHVSPDGEFAAVVHDYGRRGEVLDLHSGHMTMALDGGKYHAKTVPFSLAFARVRGRIVLIHRTAWNRLEVSDPAGGHVLSVRGAEELRGKDGRPEHLLDYFHGALHVNPSGTRIVDDGWVWGPAGIPVAWDLERWVGENAWESEDGPSKLNLCLCHYYWDRSMTWLDDERVAIGGIGDDDLEIIPGARIFDVSKRDADRGRNWVCELLDFAGPSGVFFGDGRWLYSSDQRGLSRWDPNTGERTGHIEGFQPTRYHRGAGELVQLIDRTLVRLRIGR